MSTRGSGTTGTAALFEAVRGDILSGTFAPGAVLLETALAERYGTSRTPVREVLARIEQEGLVERVVRGYRVRSGTPEDVLEIYEARIALEGAAAAAAAERRTDLDLARLRRLHELAVDAPPEQVRTLNTEWHLTLWTAAHNATIGALLVRLTAQLRIYDRKTEETADDLALTREEHAAVLAAVAERDAESARRHLSGHLQRSREVRLQRFVRNHVDAG